MNTSNHIITLKHQIVNMEKEFDFSFLLLAPGRSLNDYIDINNDLNMIFIPAILFPEKSAKPQSSLF